MLKVSLPFLQHIQALPAKPSWTRRELGHVHSRWSSPSHFQSVQFCIIHPVFNSFGLESLLSAPTGAWGLELAASCTCLWLSLPVLSCFLCISHFSSSFSLCEDWSQIARVPNRTQCLGREGMAGDGKSESLIRLVFHSYKWNPQVQDLHTMPGGSMERKQRLEIQRSG